MNLHDAIPKIIKYFFPHFFWEHGKKIHVLKSDWLINNINMINFQFFYLLLLEYLKHDLSKKLSLLCYKFMFKYLEINLKF
jgi:hypothetical protein